MWMSVVLLKSKLRWAEVLYELIENSIVNYRSGNFRKRKFVRVLYKYLIEGYRIKLSQDECVKHTSSRDINAYTMAYPHYDGLVVPNTIIVEVDAEEVVDNVPHSEKEEEVQPALSPSKEVVQVCAKSSCW